MIELIIVGIILLFEILFYSLFFKYANKKNEFWKYICAFIIFTMTMLAFESSIIYYLIFCFVIIGIMKYIMRMKIKIYDLILLYVIFIIKFIIEMPFGLIIYPILGYTITNVLCIIAKIGFVYLFRNKINKSYNIFVQKWNNNNFYVRYIGSILLIGHLLGFMIYFLTR